MSLKGDFDFSGFKWAPALNFSLNRNEVKGLGPNQEQIITGNHITMLGESIGNFMATKYWEFISRKRIWISFLI